MDISSFNLKFTPPLFKDEVSRSDGGDSNSLFQPPSASLVPPFKKRDSFLLNLYSTY